MIGSTGSVQNQAIDMLQTRRMEIYKKLASGETEEAIVTGGNAFTETVWDRMLEGVDDYLEEVKEEQQIRFEKQDAEQAEKIAYERQRNLKEIMAERAGSSLDVPYGYLAKNGIIEYEGVIFTCDAEKHAICLGDMTDKDNVISIPLSEGGCLKVNRDNLSELSTVISMFSPEDIKRIMQAIATDAKCQQMQQELDETVNSISGSTTIVSENNEANEVTAEQIAKLFEERE